jgi:type IV secretory pathway VirB2 component (pilin)
MQFGTGWTSLSDPPGASPIGAALSWLEGTLSGTIATTIAVIAIASLGFGMLTGRIDLRRGATTIAGCFILFGASSIVAGLRHAVSGASPDAPEMALVDPSPPVVVPPPAPRQDPYAGASLRR